MELLHLTPFLMDSNNLHWLVQTRISSAAKFSTAHVGAFEWGNRTPYHFYSTSASAEENIQSKANHRTPFHLRKAQFVQSFPAAVKISSSGGGLARRVLLPHHTTPDP